MSFSTLSDSDSQYERGRKESPPTHAQAKYDKLKDTMYDELKLTRMIQRLEQRVVNDFQTCAREKTASMSYEMRDVGMSAFSVFFTQSSSFLAHQRDMKLRKGHSNAESLFALTAIPSDNQIRNLLDKVSPQVLHPVYWQTAAHLPNSYWLP